jgi:hypothetical protein
MKARGARAGAPPVVASARGWLLLLPQLDAGHATLRVKLWRRLQTLGAVALKSGAHVLPDDPARLEDFQWLLRELRDAKAEGAIARCRFVAGIDDAQLVRQFDLAREAEYAELEREAQAARRARAGEEQRGRLERRLAAIRARDYFAAAGAASAAAAVGELARTQAVPKRSTSGRGALPKPGTLWITRSNVQFDRMASAWLIRRHIDAEARIRFVDPSTHELPRGSVRFDMLEGEYTHSEGRCTFEVLLDALGDPDPALRRIGEMIHDLDLREERYLHPETAGLAALLRGIAATTAADEERIERASLALDAFHRSLATSASPSPGARGTSSGAKKAARTRRLRR